MSTIKNLQQKYFSKISPLDLEILISHTIGKPKEFILTHPEFELDELKIKNLKFKIARRAKGEPVAYITGCKEFYGLDFKVNKNVLIPRPETEQIVELVISNLPACPVDRQSVIWKNKKIVIIDIGTGSGNIIISIAKWLKKSKLPITNYQLLASDISSKSLRVAKQNAKKHKVENKIKFLQGDLLKPFVKNKIFKIQNSKFKILITANLPYLSRKIYDSTPADVKKYEPKFALYSPKNGLEHYEKLFKQIKIIIPCYMLHATCYMEISPEQKNKLAKLIKNYFPQSKTVFHKDLAEKWRVCEINITPKKSVLV